MKKVLVVMLLVVSATTMVFASSLDFNLKGLAGFDGSGNKGLLIGGGAGVVYQFGKHAGIAVEANITGANLSFNHGVVLKDNFLASVPVMAWFSTNARDKLNLGAGAGLAVSFRKLSISFDVAGGARVTYWTDSFGITLGVTGTMDCFPKIKCQKNEDGSRTYTFENTDWLDNSCLVSIGLAHHFDLGK